LTRGTCCAPATRYIALLIYDGLLPSPSLLLPLPFLPTSPLTTPILLSVPACKSSQLSSHFAHIPGGPIHFLFMYPRACAYNAACLPRHDAAARLPFLHASATLHHGASFLYPFYAIYCTSRGMAFVSSLQLTPGCLIHCLHIHAAHSACPLLMQHDLLL